MKKTANKCSKNSSIFEMGMLLYIKRKRIHVRNTCSENMFGHNRSEDKGDFYLSDMKEE